MRKLVIAAAVSMSLATISVNTHALSLGEIEMYSALNQTLDAEIDIVSFGPGELEGITVGLASAEAFAAAGLQRSKILSGLRFEVEQRPDGASVVKVTSSAPVVEPFLSFLLQVDSPQGSRLVREYTLLLDPPVFVAQQSELVAAAPAVIESTDQLDSVGVSTLIERDADLSDGVVLDLVNELGDTSAVTYNEQGAITTDSSHEGDSGVLLDLRTLASTDEQNGNTDAVVDTSGLQNLSNQVRIGNDDDGGELLDLSAELFVQQAEITDDSDGIDVQLDELELFTSSNAIFDSETNGLQDRPENVVSLDSVGDIGSIGESVDLSAIIPDTSSSVVSDAVTGTLVAIEGTEVVDLNSVVYEPEVTLEQVASTMVSSDTVGISVTDQSMIASADEVLGESIDLSGIVPGGSSDVSIASAATTFNPDTYRVGSDETLWSIARAHKASGVSTRKMVAAILQANPDAFINGDMNRLRSGASLRIPADLSSGESWIAVGRHEISVVPVEPGQYTPELATVQDTLTIVGVDESASGDGMASTGGLTGVSDLDRDLEAINKKMMLAQEELTSESLQRDELSSRVVELEDSLANMKRLITLRERELGNFQAELQTAEVDSGKLATQAQAKRDEVQEDIKRLQDNISADVSIEQERIEAQADADKNLASAEAEAISVRLASEEDALKAQLAQLRIEKAELIETAQNDKLALVQQAEAEKSQLLVEAKAERERIQAELESEKARITEAAEVESARVANEARLEKEKLLAEANAERDRLAAESDSMRSRLEALEEEKNRLLAQSEADKRQLEETTRQAEEDQSRLLAEAEAEKRRFDEESGKVKDRLAALQAKASANLSDATDQGVDAAGDVMDKTTEVGSGASDMMKDLTGKGAAAVGGLLAIAPLQRVVGDRKNVLAAGGGVALLGLLSAWAFRRRRTAPVVRADRDIPIDIDTGEGRPPRAQPELRGRGGVQRVEEPRSTMGQAAVAASAAAAATGAAVSRDVSASVPRQDETSVARVDNAPAEIEPGPAHRLIDNTLLDDTITEADVYLRYGLHGQAEDLLQTAIDRAPDNEEYRLKLLDNYHDQKNVDGFKATAANYKDRFGTGGAWERIAEMGRRIDPREGLYSRDGSNDTSIVSTAAAGAVATAAAVAGSQESNAANLDETIDVGAEFSVDDLAATGDFSRADDTFGIDDLDDISLDEVDLASLDDDGTLNLEQVAGDQMSGLDLGSLDLTNPDGDSTLDNLTLDDADLNSLGDVTSSLRSGLESDLDFSDDLNADSNEMETMLDLAKAYIDMGDSDSAANALKDIVNNGNDAQRKEASDLLKNLT